MIVGLGIDLVEIKRIRRSLERFGDRFINKLLHKNEREILVFSDIAASLSAAARMAARFAAKEAGAKALGTGFAGGIGLHDIRVHSLASGQPVISFHGRAHKHALALGVCKAYLSLTHARDTAGAVVVLESHGCLTGNTTRWNHSDRAREVEHAE